MSASGSDDVAGRGQAESPQDFQRVLRSFGVEGGQYSYRPFVDRSFDVTTVPEAVEKQFDRAEHDTAVEEQGNPAPQVNVAAQSAPPAPAPAPAPVPDAVATATPEAPAARPVQPSAPPAVGARSAPAAPMEAPAAPPPAAAPPVQEAPVTPAPVPPVAEQAPPPAAPAPASVPYANVAAAPAPVAPAPQVRATGAATRMVEPFSRPVPDGAAPSGVPSRAMNSSPRPSASSITGRPMDRGVADEWSPVPKARLSPRERPRPGDLSFFFQGVRDTRDERKFFPVASTRSVRSNVSRVTSMTKTDTNSSQASRPGAPVVSPDGSPTMTEVFMTLGGRATELLNPRPSLREALLRRREGEEDS